MAYSRIEFTHPLRLNDIIPALDPEMQLVITDGIENTVRCLPADVSKNLRSRNIELIKINTDNHGTHLRIVIAVK